MEREAMEFDVVIVGGGTSGRAVARVDRLVDDVNELDQRGDGQHVGAGPVSPVQPGVHDLLREGVGVDLTRGRRDH